LRKTTIYVVSNIDRDDVIKAIAYHGLKPAGVFTSEDARSYKPRAEIFEMALLMSFGSFPAVPSREYGKYYGSRDPGIFQSGETCIAP